MLPFPPLLCYVWYIRWELHTSLTSSLLSRDSTSIGSSFIFVTMRKAALSWLSARLMTLVGDGNTVAVLLLWMLSPLTATLSRSCRQSHHGDNDILAGTSNHYSYSHIMVIMTPCWEDFMPLSYMVTSRWQWHPCWNIISLSYTVTSRWHWHRGIKSLVL